MMVPAKVSRSTTAAQNRGSVNVRIQPENDSIRWRRSLQAGLGLPEDKDVAVPEHHDELTARAESYARGPRTANT